MTSLNTVSSRFGRTAPHSLHGLYGESFAEGGAAPTSGAINLLAFNGMSPLPTSPPPYGTFNVTSTISPSPRTYTSSNTAYRLNIAGPEGPQSPSTNKYYVRGIDVNPNNNVTVRVYDTRYTGEYSQLRFWGNYLSVLQGSVNRSENETFNTRFRPSPDYQYITAPNTFDAIAVVSWYIPIPSTVTRIEFSYTKTAWAGFSITIDPAE